MLLAPQAAVSFETGHEKYFLHGNALGLRADNPQAACDANAAAIGWPRPLVFEGIVGNYCQQVNGVCRDQKTQQNPGGGPSKGYSCPGG